MERKQTSNVLDQLQFVLHKVVFGIIGWLVLSWAITCQKEATDLQNLLYSFYGYGSALLYFWFFHTTNKKSQWKAFYEHTDMVATIITVITALLLSFAIGVPKIVFQ